MAGNQWKPTAPRRDLTVYRGEDVDLSGKLSKDGQPWTPPDDTTVFWTIVDPDSFAILATWPGVLVGNEFSLHVEKTALATLLSSIADRNSGPQIRFYIQTPDTTDGNPHMVSMGTVKYV